MKKVLFIDRDGTLIIEPEDKQVDSLEKLEFYPGVFQHLSHIAQTLDFELVMVSNQDGLGTPSFPEEAFRKVQDKIIKALKNEGIEFQEILIDPSRPEDNSPNRKPGTGMLRHFMKGAYDLENSYVIGDRLSDVQLAEHLGAKAIYLGHEKTDNAIHISGWAAIDHILSSRHRTAKVIRQTRETSVEVAVNIDGTGKSNIATGLGFLDHMLVQIAQHGKMDLMIKAAGDLHVDEHHTIEDTALTLGAAISQALGSKRGIERYGFTLPMDDCLARVAVDFGGRPWIVWQAGFKREQIGDVPTEMFFHFFKSFSDAAECNLNVKAEGKNEHHKIEAIFKAFAKAIKMAVRQTGDGSIPSTKGYVAGSKKMINKASSLAGKHKKPQTKPSPTAGEAKNHGRNRHTR